MSSEESGPPEAEETQSVEHPHAMLRPSRRLTWVWVVPAIAAAIVLWLGWQTLSQRGPRVEIVFTNGDGLDPGRTRIRHKNVNIGTVDTVHLSDDLSHVIVEARLNRDVGAHLNDATRFWIVRPRITPEGVSGLTTLLSGAYIEMDPGTSKGKPPDRYIGQEQPAIEEPDEPGTRFTLTTANLGSLTQGSEIYYHGLAVGEVLGYQLDQAGKEAGKEIDVYANIRTPYDKLVTAQSRFWNASGVAVSLGAQGLKVTGGLQAVLAGSVNFNSFDTSPPAPAASVPVPTTFPLYADEGSARDGPRGPKSTYIVIFDGQVRGLGFDSDVELEGTPIGKVKDLRLQYDPKSGALQARVLLSTDTIAVPLTTDRTAGNGQREGLAGLVASGLRASIVSSSLLTGQKLVSLDIVPGTPPARLTRDGPYEQIPSVPATDMDALIASAGTLVSHLDKIATGPELKSSLVSLDRTLANLSRITHQAGPQIAPLLISARQTMGDVQKTLTAAIKTLAAADTTLGGGGGGVNSDIPTVLNEVTEAARSIKELTDYLDQHPESLLRGRGGRK